MFSLGSIHSARLAVPLALLALSGCSGHEGAAPNPETATAPRSFRPVHEGRWLGNAICYGPHRDGQRPGGPGPSAAELREDLALMRPHWQLLRTYGASDFARTLLELIRADSLDMKVLLGAWVSPDSAANRQEAEAAIALAAEYPDIVLAVCVGNETQVSWSPHPCPLELLLAQVRRVRAAVAVPVTAADDYQYWLTPASRALAREVDFITMHAHPLWNGRQLDEALPWLREQLAAVAAAHAGRPVVIGETGWATSVAATGEQARLIKGKTGEAEQAVFYRTARAWAEEERVPCFVFEAFDENWKGGDDPAEVEKHWGLFRADRTAKAALVGT